MKIVVNGQARELEPDSTVADLLVTLGLRTELVAVEKNCVIVPRGEHPSTRIEDGDNFEIVTLVGGG